MVITHKLLVTLGELLVLFALVYAGNKYYEKMPGKRRSSKEAADFYLLIRVVAATTGILIVLEYFFGPFGQ